MLLDGLRSGRRPATWAQKQMWVYLRWMEPEASRHNITMTEDVVHAETSLAGVLTVITTVMRRHESLRTRYRLDDAGRLLQCLSPQETVTVSACEAGGVATSMGSDDSVLLEELHAAPFDMAKDLLIRWMVITRDGAPVRIAFTAAHIAMDGTAAMILRRELGSLLGSQDTAVAERSLGAPGRQPFERAEFECSVSGRKRSGRAARQWRGILEGMPRTLMSVDHSPEAVDPRFIAGHLRSRALGPALRVLARRLSTSTTNVALAATAYVLARAGGVTRCAVALVYSNRAVPEDERSVATLVQNVCAVIDTSRPNFGELVDASRRAALQGYLSGPYDPVLIDRTRDEIAWRRGIEPDLSTFFNDIRSLGHLPCEDVDDDEMSAEDIRKWSRGSEFTWSPGVAHEYVRMSVLLADDAPGWTRLGVAADSRCYPPGLARLIIQGIERVVVAALDDMHLDHLAPEVGVSPPARGGDWLVVEDAWVDTGAVHELVTTATGCRAEDVSVSADDGLLTVRLRSGDTVLTPELAHAACMRELLSDRRSAHGAETEPVLPRMWLGEAMAPRWPTAMAPQRYMIYACPQDGPEGCSPVWNDGDLLADGPGRSR
ncbi:condensation domain-containing protein [Sphaerisporangium rhizosphaerae]|uniref:Condensation domain-containing protein n=1 Tax=Sphaerisporangium rhizosphaerae TaxID=2269375 RepID=A0ABW2PCN0_9ACTN